MNLQTLDPHTVVVSGLSELVAANAAATRDAIRAALSSACRQLDIDLSATTFLDSSGLGALLALHKTLTLQQGRVRLLNPAPNVQQILELTRLHRVFEIVQP
jgi:anti-sigma B factor antagonist